MKDRRHSGQAKARSPSAARGGGLGALDTAYDPALTAPYRLARHLAQYVTGAAARRALQRLMEHDRRDRLDAGGRGYLEPDRARPVWAVPPGALGVWGWDVVEMDDDAGLLVVSGTAASAEDAKAAAEAAAASCAWRYPPGFGRRPSTARPTAQASSAQR